MDPVVMNQAFSAVVATATARLDGMTWIRILSVVAAAYLASLVLPRLIRKAVRKLLDVRLQRRLAALRAHAPRALLDTAPMPAIRYSQRAEAIGTLFRDLSRIAIWFAATVIILHDLHVALATVVSGAGFLGLAIAFGAQNVLRDYLGGFFILLDDRFGIGDRVEAGSITGDVEEVTLRWTRIRDLEGTEWYVPNGRMEEVGNRSQHRGKAVIDVPLPLHVPLSHGISRISDAIGDIRRDPSVGAFVLDDPEILGVEAMDLETVTIRVVVPTQTLKQAEVARVVRARIRTALEAPVRRTSTA